MKKGLSIKEIILVVLLIVTMIFILYFSLIKPFLGEKPKYEITSQEKSSLVIMTQAFLNQNEQSYSFSKILGNCLLKNINNRYAVGAEYYYLLNHKIALEDNDKLYDEILSLTKEIFDDNDTSFENFTVNTDSCGMEKYSSLEGNIINETCDTKDTIYQIGDVYKQDDYYVVEFYAANAIKTKTNSNNCEELEKSLSYNLQLSKLDGTNYYDVNHNYCCKVDEICTLSGFNDIKQEIINQAKINDNVYKIKYQKNGKKFIYYELAK